MPVSVSTCTSVCTINVMTNNRLNHFNVDLKTIFLNIMMYVKLIAKFNYLGAVNSIHEHNNNANNKLNEILVRNGLNLLLFSSL